MQFIFFKFWDSMGLNMGNQACSNTQNSSHNLADSNKNSYFAAVSSKLILGACDTHLEYV